MRVISLAETAPMPSPKHTEAAPRPITANRILSRLVRLAYRHTPTDQDLKPLLDLYASARKTGDFESGIEAGLERILIAPEFLFRIEKDPAKVSPSKAYRVNDVQLASRLSFFLWSSIPDDELLRVAERGQLKNPKVLEQQVKRMLADRRASSLVTNFADQWLQVRSTPAVSPDVYTFPEFDDTLRGSMQRETELFVETVLREDRSVQDLLRTLFNQMGIDTTKVYYTPQGRPVPIVDGGRVIPNLV